MRTICFTLSLLLSGSFVVAARQSRPQPLSPSTAEPQRLRSDGARIAVVDLQRIARESIDGKAAAAQLSALSTRNATDVERAQLQDSLQAAFSEKLTPILREAAIDLGFQMILSKADGGILWVDSGLDVTTEILKRFDNSGNTKPAAVVKAVVPKEFWGIWIEQASGAVEDVNRITITGDSVVWSRSVEGTHTITADQLQTNASTREIRFPSKVTYGTTSGGSAGRVEIQLTLESGQLVVNIGEMKEPVAGGAFGSWRAGTAIEYEVVNNKEVPFVKRSAERHVYTKGK